MNDTDRKISLGMFVVTCGIMRVTDPCYSVDTWCTGEFPAMNGRWHAQAIIRDCGDWGDRVAEIIVQHESDMNADPTEKTSIDAGVDSGQLGFFDAAQYAKNHGGEYNDMDSFYGRACAMTVGMGQYGGTFPFGAVTSTGYGDGSYDCFVKLVNSKAVAAKVVFLPDEDDETED